MKKLRSNKTKILIKTIIIIYLIRKFKDPPLISILMAHEVKTYN